MARETENKRNTLGCKVKKLVDIEPFRCLPGVAFHHLQSAADVSSVANSTDGFRLCNQADLPYLNEDAL